MKEQHGFRSSYSTYICNILIYNYVFNSFRYGSQVDVIYTDFNKTFDSVNHKVLVQLRTKPEFGIPFLSWVKSHHNDWYRWIKVFVVKSYLFLAASGIPQWVNLSPYCFPYLLKAFNVFCGTLMVSIFPMI